MWLLRQVPYSTTANTPPFQRAKRGPFYQEPPVLYNPFVEDTVLRTFLKRTLPEKVNVEEAIFCVKNSLNFIRELTYHFLVATTHVREYDTYYRCKQLPFKTLRNLVIGL